MLFCKNFVEIVHKSTFLNFIFFAIYFHKHNTSMDTLSAFGPFEFCDDCFPAPSTDRFQDPSGVCDHSSRPKDFFQRLATVFPTDGPPEDSRAGHWLAAAHAPGRRLPLPAEARHLNLYAVFFTLPWRLMLTSIPLRCPVSSVCLSMRMLDNRQRYFSDLRDSNGAATVRLAIQAFAAAHGVSVSYGSHAQKSFLPVYRQWLPCYAPVQYFSPVEFSGYAAVPVNPRVSNLAGLLQYRDRPELFNGPKTPLGADESAALERHALVESRAAVSDQELERRIIDLQNLKAVLGDTLLEFGDEDSIGFVQDIDQLLLRYSDELAARTLYSTSFVFASYLFSMSSSYETTRGARYGQVPFSDQFAIAYYRMLERGLVLRSSSAVYCMTPEFFANVRRCREAVESPEFALLPLDDAIRDRIHCTSVYGTFMPRVLFS